MTRAEKRRKRKFERCVRKLKRRRGVMNPWAVCNAAVKK